MAGLRATALVVVVAVVLSGALLLAQTAAAKAALYTETTLFANATCAGLPDNVVFEPATESCSGFSCLESGTYYVTQVCNASTITFPGDTPYFVVASYVGAGCTTLRYATGIKTGVCTVSGTASYTYACNGTIVKITSCSASTTCSGTSCYTFDYPAGCQLSGTDSYTYECSTTASVPETPRADGAAAGPLVCRLAGTTWRAQYRASNGNGNGQEDVVVEDVLELLDSGAYRQTLTAGSATACSVVRAGVYEHNVAGGKLSMEQQRCTQAADAAAACQCVTCSSGTSMDASTADASDAGTGIATGRVVFSQGCYRMEYTPTGSTAAIVYHSNVFEVPFRP